MLLNVYKKKLLILLLYDHNPHHFYLPLLAHVRLKLIVRLCTILYLLYWKLYLEQLYECQFHIKYPVYTEVKSRRIFGEFRAFLSYYRFEFIVGFTFGHESFI